MSFHVVIPARYASQRLPGKPLLDIAGKPMIQHVYERADESGAQSVIIATDDERIVTAVTGFGGNAAMTAEHHRSGTERLAEVAEQQQWPDDTIVVNLQGDEPMMAPELLLQVADNLANNGDADMATLCVTIESAEELFNPNAVKVVMADNGFALYFSRAPIPWHRDHFATTQDSLPTDTTYYRHLGIYAYRVGFLKHYVAQAPCTLETIESLEQLRALHYGGKIHVAVAKHSPGPGVDTQDDLTRVRQLMA